MSQLRSALLFLFGVLLMLGGLVMLLTSAHAMVTVDDLESGVYAEGYVMPSQEADTSTHCVGPQGDMTCTTRRITPDPSGCPEGQALVTLRAWGNVNRRCVPE